MMADTLAVILDHEATDPGSRTRETEKFEFSGNYLASDTLHTSLAWCVWYYYCYWNLVYI